MKTLLKSFIAILSLVAFSQTAKASLLVEPYLGYVSGKAKLSSSVNLTGTGYGARVGFSHMGFAAGVDYSAASLKDDGSPSIDYKAGDLGLFVAFKFPVLVRAYVTYIPSPELKANAGGADFTYKSGNLVKLGVGFTGLPFVNLNLEYFSGTYGQINSLDIDPKLTTSGIALSVSAPFNFL